MRALALFIPALVALAAAASPFVARAEVTRCTDANGAVSYTNVECPAGSKQARQVPILEAPPPDPPRRDRLDAPQRAAPPAPPPSRVASNPPSGPAIIPRFPAGTQPQPAAEPPGVVVLNPDPYYDPSYDPYYDGARPIRRPRPHHLVDPGPPPGQRPCQNLAGIKRNNC